MDRGGAWFPELDPEPDVDVRPMVAGAWCPSGTLGEDLEAAPPPRVWEAVHAQLLHEGIIHT